jgi:hypothetical protein
MELRPMNRIPPLLLLLLLMLKRCKTCMKGSMLFILPSLIEYLLLLKCQFGNASKVAAIKRQKKKLIS